MHWRRENWGIKNVNLVARGFLAYDNAPEYADGLFMKKADSPQDIAEHAREILHSLYLPIQATLDVIAAKNYAVMNSLFSRSDISAAKMYMQHLLDTDETIIALHVLTSNFGHSYADECIGQRRLVTPTQLDEALFEAYAPQSAIHAHDYFTQEGLAVFCSEYGEPVYVMMVVENKPDETYNPPDYAHSLVAIIEDTQNRIFPVSGTDDEILAQIHRKFESIGVKEYKLIRTDHFEFPIHLQQRFHYRKMGQLIREFDHIPNVNERSASV